MIVLFKQNTARDIKFINIVSLTTNNPLTSGHSQAHMDVKPRDFVSLA